MWPVIDFQVDLSKTSQGIAFGTITNEHTENVMPVDSGQTAPMGIPASYYEAAWTNKYVRPMLVSAWLPGLKLANRNLNHGDTFQAQGQEAVYLKNTYGIDVAGVPLDRQILKII